MGLFNSKPKQQLKNINGYIIDELTGMLIDVPKGLEVYTIPKEVKKLNPDLSLMTNKPLVNMSGATEIIFEDGSIDVIPDGYFTFGGSKVFLNLKKVTLPVGIMKIGNNCIDATKTKFNIPTTLHHLGANMYPETQRLVLGNNIDSLGNGFASHDTYLKYVEVAGTIKQLPPLFVNQCKNLETLILHEGIEIAGKDAFRGLNSLQYIELPESFKMPFQTTMEGRPGNNKRGNSRYDAEKVFKEHQNQILTIKKIISGNYYTIRIRRGDFNEISFQNNIAQIKSSNGETMIIALEKLTPNSTIEVDIKQKSFQQYTQPKNPIQSNSQAEQYTHTPVQRTQEKPIVNSNIHNYTQQQFSSSNITQQHVITAKFSDDQILDNFQKIYKESIINNKELFETLSVKEKKYIRIQLYYIFENLVNMQKKLDLSPDVLNYYFQNLVENLRKQEFEATTVDGRNTDEMENEENHEMSM